MENRTDYCGGIAHEMQGFEARHLSNRPTRPVGRPPAGGADARPSEFAEGFSDARFAGGTRSGRSALEHAAERTRGVVDAVVAPHRKRQRSRDSDTSAGRGGRSRARHRRPAASDHASEHRPMTTHPLVDIARTRSRLASWQFGQLAVFFLLMLFLLPLLHHGLLVKSISTLFVLNSLLVADSSNPNARGLRWIGWCSVGTRAAEQRRRRISRERGADVRDEVPRHRVHTRCCCCSAR